MMAAACIPDEPGRGVCLREVSLSAPVAAGFGAAAFMAPLLQNLCLSMGDNEEACFCLKV